MSFNYAELHCMIYILPHVIMELDRYTIYFSIQQPTFLEYFKFFNIFFYFQYLSISPIRGRLAPGESRMCRVVFIACGVPSFYDLDLVCEVSIFYLLSVVALMPGIQNVSCGVHCMQCTIIL